MGQTLQGIDVDDDFLRKIPKVQAAKTKPDKRDYIKFRSFCTAQKTNQQSEKTADRVGENIFKLIIQ